MSASRTTPKHSFGSLSPRRRITSAARARDKHFMPGSRRPTASTDQPTTIGIAFRPGLGRARFVHVRVRVNPRRTRLNRTTTSHHAARSSERHSSNVRLRTGRLNPISPRARQRILGQPSQTTPEPGSYRSRVRLPSEVRSGLLQRRYVRRRESSTPGCRRPAPPAQTVAADGTDRLRHGARHERRCAGRPLWQHQALAFRRSSRRPCTAYSLNGSAGLSPNRRTRPVVDTEPSDPGTNAPVPARAMWRGRYHPALGGRPYRAIPLLARRRTGGPRRPGERNDEQRRHGARGARDDVEDLRRCAFGRTPSPRPGPRPARTAAEAERRSRRAPLGGP